MKIAYVAGKYRGKAPSDIYDNIAKARDVAIKLWKLGYATICPHLNTQFMDGIVPDDSFLKGDLEIIERCDLVVVVDNWEDSEGAKAEVILANIKGIPAFEFNKKGKLYSL